MTPRPPPRDPDAHRVVKVTLVGQNERGYHLAWITQSAGRGALSVWAEPDGGVRIDCPLMRRAFVLPILARFARETPTDDWPPLLREYGSAEVLVGAAAGAWQ